MKSKSALVHLLLLTVSFFIIAGLQSSRLDFPLTDGAYYFDQAHLFAHSGLRPDREWSPLFVIGYGILHWLFPPGSPLLLYLTHRLLVLYGAALLFWVLSRKLFPEPVPLLLSVAFLGHASVLYDYPVVHVAGVGFVLILLVGALSPPRNRGMIPILLGLCSLGIWIRPEILAILAALTLLFLKSVLTRRHRLIEMHAWGTLAICVLMSLGIYAFSAATPGPSRAFEAFSQRFLWSRLQASSGTLRSGHLDHAEQIAASFGEAESIPEAFLRNPEAFMGHVLDNVFRLAPEAPWVVLPGSWSEPWAAVLFLLLLFLFLQPGTPVPTTPLFWLVAGTAGLAGLALALILEPAPHYLLPAVPLALVATTLLLKKLREILPDWRFVSRAIGRHSLPLLAAGLAVLVFLLVPRAPGREKQVVELSEALARVRPGPQTIRVQAFSGVSYCAYLRALDRSCLEVPIESIRSSAELSAFLVVKELDALVVDDFLRQFYRDSRSPALNRFEAAPQRFGFEVRLRTEGEFLGQATLYVRTQSEP